LYGFFTAYQRNMAISAWVYILNTIFEQWRATDEEWQVEHSTSELWCDGEMFASVTEPQSKSPVESVIPLSARKVAHWSMTSTLWKNL
jgi:hypothetical protein